MASDHLIELKNVTKEFDGTEALKDINLYIDKKEFLTLLGPSGCGKTTMLRIIAGFEQPSSGRVFLDGRDITDVPPHMRSVNTVFQKYALFPHMNVYDNVAFGMKLKKKDKHEIDKKVRQMLDMVGLRGYHKRDVDSLSGGQQQRVAIARALANEPEILLLDEPLGALDLKMRQGMQLELKSMQQQLDITFIYVTHDQEEALTMSDTIVVMQDGLIQQIGSPIDIYNEPKNAFVADFIGESNIIDGIMLDDYSVRFNDKDFVCVDRGFGQYNPVEVVVRPEDVKLTNPTQAMLRGIVKSILFMGVHYEIKVECSGYTWLIHSTQHISPGEDAGLEIQPNDIHIMAKGGSKESDEA